MNIAVIKERRVGERRVALTPEGVIRLKKSGLSVMVESGAGESAFISDRAFREAGADIFSDLGRMLLQADILLKVNPPQSLEDRDEIDLLRPGTVLAGFLNPFGNPALVKRLASRGLTAFSLELMPRIARAQSMDALSSQASIAGYKAVLMAANALGKFFPMLMTAAGTVSPARILVVGAGVAGLQAIATARRLGAIVEAFDIRPEVKEQVESLGAKFLEVETVVEGIAEGGYAKEVSEETRRREQQLLGRHVALADAIITTAMVPGKKAPLLITEPMVASMKPGGVIVDLAAEQGGNCELTQPGADVTRHGVTIMGPVNLPSTMPVHASEMYARNITAFTLHLLREGIPHPDFEDEIIRAVCITHNGLILNEGLRELAAAA